MDANVAAFQINGGVNGETADSIFVIFNANFYPPNENFTLYFVFYLTTKPVQCQVGYAFSQKNIIIMFRNL